MLTAGSSCATPLKWRGIVIPTTSNSFQPVNAQGSVDFALPTLYGSECAGLTRPCSTMKLPRAYITAVTIFQVTWGAWIMIIGMTIIMVLVNYILFRFYIQFSPKINKVVLISGLGFISIIGDLTWLFYVRLLTPLQKGHFLRRYRHMYGFGYCKSTICSGCLLKS